MVDFIKKLTVIIGLALPVFSAAQTISPAMLEQFKKLPKSEQVRLAKQYGIDPASLTNGQSSVMPSTDEMQPLTPKGKAAAESELEQENAKQQEAKSEGPKRFGVDLFDSKVTTFAPTGFIPVPDHYLLGPDDNVKLQLFGKVNQEYEVTVNRDGTVFVPDIGSVTVAGLTFSEAQKLLKAKVSQSLLGVETVVSMGKLRTISIFIAGEAKFPGSYTVSALTSVTQALFVAGGVSEIGSLRHIFVKRNGKLVQHFDAYDLLLRGDAKNDVSLQNGDVVFIEPVRALAEVTGEVQRPALFEVTAEDTLDTLLKMAGGAKSGAYLKSAVVQRFNDQQLRTLVNVDLTALKDKNIPARAGDVLRIGVTSPRIANQITLAGAVVRPGRFAWYPGMKVSDLISSVWSDLYPSVDLDYALVLRQINTQTDIKVLQFNLGEAVTEAGSAEDIALAAGDTVLVFHYGNMSVNRDSLNERIKTRLKARFDIPEFERWMSDESLVNEGFALLTAVEEKRQARTIAGYTISDNVVADKAVRAQQVAPLSYDAMLLEQQDALKAQVQFMLEQVYVDDEILQISAQFTRHELLYTVLEKLKRQARYGEQPRIASISGETVLQGEFPLPENGTVADLIAAASGLKESAFIRRAELTRLTRGEVSSSAELEHVQIDLEKELDRQNGFATQLNSRDRLNVFAVPDWNIERLVEVRGEVRFPGRYSVQKGETLSSVLKRAGGIVDGAFVKGAVFTRQKVKEREQIQMNKLIEQLTADVATRALSAEETVTSPQESIAMIAQLRKAQPMGRLVVDMQSILSESVEADIVLEDGDLLYVPRMNSAITIVGEVQNASSHRYRSNMTVEDYLAQAGGFRKRADEDRIYIIKADGSVSLPRNNRWFAVTQSQLEPGDTIVVPLDTEYTNNMTLWTQVTQIFYQSAVALAAVASF